MTNEKAAEWIVQSKKWRKTFDGILQEMKDQQRSEHERHDSGRHLAIAITELENVIMRLGKRMQEIDKTNPSEQSKNPYPQSYNPDNARVDPQPEGLKI